VNQLTVSQMALIFQLSRSRKVQGIGLHLLLPVLSAGSDRHLCPIKHADVEFCISNFQPAATMRG
jgi:hypothetical protein